MKTPVSKQGLKSHRNNSPPFFSKTGEGNFFAKEQKIEELFFSSAKIQTRSDIDPPEKPSEHEARRADDRMTHRLINPATTATNQETSHGVRKPNIATIQRKCEEWKEEYQKDSERKAPAEKGQFSQFIGDGDYPPIEGKAPLRFNFRSSPTNQSLFAQKRPHIEQRSGSIQRIQRETDDSNPARSYPTLQPSDLVQVRIEAGSANGDWKDEMIITLRLNDDGEVRIPRMFTIRVQAPLDEAARLITQQLLDGYLRYPRATLTFRGRSFTHAPSIGENVRARDRAYSNHISFLDGQAGPARAIANYRAWITEHRNDNVLLEVTAEQAWERAIRESSPSPRALKLQEWDRMLHRELEAVRTLPSDEASYRLNAIERMTRWIAAHQNDDDFATIDLNVPFVRYRITALQNQATTSQLTPTAPAPTAGSGAEATMAHFDKFMLLAQLLRGDHPISSYRRILVRASARDVSVFTIAIQLGVHPQAAPRVIEVPSEGYNILILGDPARRFALRLLASAIMQWASDRMSDPDFVNQDPLAVANLMMQYQGFDELFAWSRTQPLQTERIARHDIQADRALLAFGTTVLSGLAVVALVGAAVGAGIVTGGAATVIMLGVAGTMAGKAYLDRREEVEQQNYEVPIPLTALHAIGDVVGLSQLIEGLTGERLGTGEQLNSIERSEQLGTGAGGVATLFLGSRAYRSGYRRGAQIRSFMPRRPLGPAGSADPQIPDAEVPRQPTRNPSPGPIEARIRASLPDGEQVGLDLFIERLGENPEMALSRMGDHVARGQARNQAMRHQRAVREFRAAESMRGRLNDNPLNPRLRHTEQHGDVTVRYEQVPPSAAEIAQAQQLAQTSGRPVTLFGDTPTGLSYPGIDGVIDVVRPLSLKEAAPNWVRTVAQDAHTLALRHGYSETTVHISVRDGTLAEALRGWRSSISVRDGTELGKLFNGRTIYEIILQDSTGATHRFTSPTGRAVPPIPVVNPDQP